jgi:hypothetical protein
MVALRHWSVKSTLAPPVVGARFTVGFVKYVEVGTLSPVVTLRYG